MMFFWLLQSACRLFGIVLAGVFLCSCFFYSECSSKKFENFYDFPFLDDHGPSYFAWLKNLDLGWPCELKNQSFDIPPTRVEGHDIRASFVGHSTWFLQLCGMNIITDPVWSSRAGPLNIFGPKRVAEPGIEFDELPPVDVVIISHNHYDHLDLSTLERIWKRDMPLMLVPLGNEKLIRNKLGKEANVVALDWGESFVLNQDLKFILEPSHHWSSRCFYDRDQMLWGSFVIASSAGNIYFAGDTAYSKHFDDIGSKYDSFRLALLPIGDYNPFVKFHMSPDQAVSAHQILKSQLSIGMHFSTFRLSETYFGEPVFLLEFAKKSAGLLKKEFIVLREGQFIMVP